MRNAAASTARSYERRDVRSHFLAPQPVPDDVLGRILDAAHHARSVGGLHAAVGFSGDPRCCDIRQAVYRNFESARRHAGEAYKDEQRKLYDSLKLAGIIGRLRSAYAVCVTCDHTRPKGNGLGRQTDPAVALYSTVCAVQNLWRAARAESLGVGWVSILDLEQLKSTLGIPAELTLVAYLCIEAMSLSFGPSPTSKKRDGKTRSTLASVTHASTRWGSPWVE